MARGDELIRLSHLGRLALGCAIAGGTLACQSPPPQAPRTSTLALDSVIQAREAVQRRDYLAASGVLRQALDRRPADLEAHYLLAVSWSHLDQADEATREFEWVVAHGQAGAPEVQIARDWLAARTPPEIPAPSVSPAVNGAGIQRPELATLSGKAIGPDKPMARLQLFLKGVPTSTVKDEYHLLRTDQQGNFNFPNVVPGDYMLTNAVAGPVLWRLRVALGGGQHLVVDLSPANSSTIRDDFPERSR
jgi:hypothetical protein